MSAIISVPAETAEDLQATLDHVTINIAEITEKLSKLRQEKAEDADTLYALQLMQEEEENHRKTVELVNQLQKQKEQEERDLIARYSQPSAGREDNWETVASLSRSSKKKEEPISKKKDEEEEEEDKHNRKQDKPSKGKQQYVLRQRRLSSYDFRGYRHYYSEHLLDDICMIE
jgi:hypothetical protein